MQARIELTFAGSALVRDFPRYRRWHPTIESATSTAFATLAKVDNRNAHPAIVYGPGLGPDGRAVAAAKESEQ